MNPEANGIGTISEEIPSTNRMLKILLPTTFPTAISAFPFLAAATEVASSGREVPWATMVSPINFSDRPAIGAIFTAASTAILLHNTTTTPPPIIKARYFKSVFICKTELVILSFWKVNSY